MPPSAAQARRPRNRASTTRYSVTQQQGPKKSVVIAGRKLPVYLEMLDMLFTWMAERDRIRRKRLSGRPPPWSKDDVLREHKFCNVYRVYDRGTQFVMQEVINKGSQDHQEVCFRVILFKLFNRITTWEFLKEQLGTPSWGHFNLKTYSRVLAAAKKANEVIYTSAYQIPAPKLGSEESFENHLRLLKMMMDDDLPGRLLRYKHLKDACAHIRTYPSIGPFIGYQLLLDLNMSPHLNYPENEWASCGPGSTNYLRMIFGDAVLGIETHAIAYLYSSQDIHFTRLNITDPPRLREGFSGVGFVDIEHSLCECSKYYRLRGVKGVWKASLQPLTSFLPTKTTHTISVEAGLVLDAVGGLRGSPLTSFSDDEDDMESEVDETDYEVSHIVSERPGPGGLEFKVRWTGYGPEDDMWLPEGELRNAPDVLKQWRSR